MAKPKQPIRPRNGRRTRNTASQQFLRAALLAFAGGTAVCVLLLALFALILAHTPLPLSLVRPLACLGAAAGAAVSGLLLAKKLGKQYLLCGLGCGFFYSVCQIAAAVAAGGALPARSADLMLPVALLLSGTLGGALAALRPEH